jgi:hypothetical protein
VDGDGSHLPTRCPAGGVSGGGPGIQHGHVAEDRLAEPSANTTAPDSHALSRLGCRQCCPPGWRRAQRGSLQKTAQELSAMLQHDCKPETFLR